MAWTWRFEDVQGNRIETEVAQRPEFSSQSDAESWVGECWRDLLADGVAQVTLFENDRLVYGPMSLQSPE